MCLIDAGKYVAIIVGTSGELCEKGRKRVVEILFIGVLKIEIEIRQRG